MAPTLHRLLLDVFGRLPRQLRRRIVRFVSPSFTVGAVCVIERSDGCVLLIRQRYRKRWGLPGGLLERGEAPGDAARREVLEEVGLEIDLVGEPGVVVEPAPQRVDVVYRAVPAAGTDVDDVSARSPEITATGWFRLDKLPPIQDETVTALMSVARGATAGLLGPHDRRRSTHE